MAIVVVKPVAWLAPFWMESCNTLASTSIQMFYQWTTWWYCRTEERLDWMLRTSIWSLRLPALNLWWSDSAVPSLVPFGRGEHCRGTRRAAKMCLKGSYPEAKVPPHRGTPTTTAKERSRIRVLVAREIEVYKRGELELWVNSIGWLMVHLPTSMLSTNAIRILSNSSFRTYSKTNKTCA